VNAAQVAVEALPRPRRRALGIAAGTLWLPCLLPIVLGMLRDCGHCMETYLKMFAMVPGVIVPVLLRLEDVWFGVVAVAVTLGALGGLYAAAREMPRGLLYALQGVVMVLVGVESIGLVAALRA